jgi:hypothetical protein
MALESAQYPSQLVVTNPLSTDSVSQSDDHLRLIKTVLVNTFPNLSAPVTATSQQLNYPVPQGVILLWSGAVASVPAGYHLCDGTNGTPDLRGVFVVGAGGSYAPNATGGTAVTGFAGSHTHTLNGTTDNPTVGTGDVQSGAGAAVVTSVAAISHTHTVNLVGDHQHSCLPPYLALAYIMKL